MTDNSGPAFPMASSKYDVPQHGMTLRQWYAGQALPLLAAYGAEAEIDQAEIAQRAFEYADAMLAEDANMEEKK